MLKFIKDYILFLWTLMMGIVIIVKGEAIYSIKKNYPRKAIDRVGDFIVKAFMVIYITVAIVVTVIALILGIAL